MLIDSSSSTIRILGFISLINELSCSEGKEVNLFFTSAKASVNEDAKEACLFDFYYIKICFKIQFLAEEPKAGQALASLPACLPSDTTRLY
jgi:hypothetical protein